MQPRHVLVLGRLLRDERRSPGALAALQGKKLVSLVGHAYRNVPYYRDVFSSLGLKPGDIRGIEDLSLIPVTEKSALRKAPPREITAPVSITGPVRSLMTSGSTGTPFEVLISAEDLTLRNLVSARANMASGLKPWHKIGVVVLQDRAGGKSSWYERVGLWRRNEVSSARPAEEWLSEFRRWRPDILVGRMSTLRLLAETAGPGVLRPRLVFSSAELLDETSRRGMAGVFGCPVLDYYYSFEGGCLAWECRKCRGYHLNSDVVIVEVLNEGRPAEPGEDGEVVITNLHSAAMPFIRYRQGDRVTVSMRKPACGRNLPLIENIRGRTDDYLRLPGGRRVAPQAVSWVFMALPGVKKWKVVQDRRDHVLMMVEPGPEYGPETGPLLRVGMRKLLGEDVAVDLSVLASIPQDPVHKFRCVFSDIKEG